MAIELMAAGQGVELRRPLQSSPLLERALRQVRSKSAFLQDDRPLGGDIVAIAQAILEGEFGGDQAFTP